MGSHIHTHTHTRYALRCNQTHAHAYTLQAKLVLINLAGGTRHVFPFTSWPVPWVAQWKPSILVCLQFVCLNFLLICIIHWWPVGLAQEEVSEHCCAIFFHSDIVHHAFVFFHEMKKRVTQLDHSLLTFALRRESFWRFIVVLSLKIAAEQCFERSSRRRGLSARAVKTVRRCTSVCDSSGQMFFSLIHLLSELRTLQLITPLTIFYFSQYQKAHRSWVEEKMLCLTITRGQVFDAGTVKFVIC